MVIIVDHYGKDTTRGLIGSIARESLAYFVLTPGDKLGGDLSKSRQLVVRKMRDGFGGPGMGPPGGGRGGPMRMGGGPGPGGIFRSYRFGMDHPAFQGRKLVPGKKIEEL